MAGRVRVDGVGVKGRTSLPGEDLEEVDERDAVRGGDLPEDTEVRRQRNAAEVMPGRPENQKRLGPFGSREADHGANLLSELRRGEPWTRRRGRPVSPPAPAPREEGHEKLEQAGAGEQARPPREKLCVLRVTPAVPDRGVVPAKLDHDDLRPPRGDLLFEKPPPLKRRVAGNAGIQDGESRERPKPDGERLPVLDAEAERTGVAEADDGGGAVGLRRPEAGRRCREVEPDRVRRADPPLDERGRKTGAKLPEERPVEENDLLECRQTQLHRQSGKLAEAGVVRRRGEETGGTLQKKQKNDVDDEDDGDDSRKGERAR